ncbi:mediator of RNA polymerase II transcription subunit 23-like [Tubulanus polymorphus]|uniref:mediator of RNA polymerase II transcription subunit 23-like n=1 Tax=Tubulanus polymorphus TaxID=672921 RepID=UPI003DA4F24F
MTQLMGLAGQIPNSLPPVINIDDKVDNMVQQILRADVIQECFGGYIVRSDKNEKMMKDSSFSILRHQWNTLTVESQDAFIHSFVQNIHKQRNIKRIQMLMDMLESMVEHNLVPAKAICESLVNCDKLNYKACDLWCSSFWLMRKIIGGVDYKGCRDLLRLILEKCSLIPQSENISALAQVEALQTVVDYILDRNACLLPSYFAVNEITKLFPDDRPWPHWKLGERLSRFVQSFRPTAQMVTVAGRSNLLPIVGHSSPTVNMWKLNPSTLRFALSGPLPYDKALYESQTGLLRYVLEQPYSRDMVCSMLSLNKQMKQRSVVLEEQLVDLVVLAMERSENEEGDDGSMSQLLWQHLSSQLIFLVLFQFASFPHMVMELYSKLQGRNLRKGRDHLMWVLLQFISGSIQKNPLVDFLPVLKLYDLLYPEDEVLADPDINKPSCTYAMAATCIWIHLSKKAQNDKEKLKRPFPNSIKGHLEMLKVCLNNKQLPMTDYRIALLCNAYSTNSDYFALPMGVLVETIYGNGKTNTTTMLPGNVPAAAPIHPLPMSLLDSLTVHAKMSLIHSIVARVIRLGQTKANFALAPALVETYSRLLVYMEIETLGIKGFISQLLPNVFKSHAWGILHTLLEMFSYRLHHIQPHYRVQLLGHLHSLSSLAQTNQTQLHLCVESTALRLITGLGSSEVQPQLSRFSSEPKTLALLSGDSEELNRALVLTLARALHVTGAETLSSSWCKEILASIMQSTPHGWSTHTLSCFPHTLNEFFQANPIQKEDKGILKRNVETEYRKWKSMGNENDIIAHFSMQGTSPLFLCILWKSLLEDNRISPIGYKVLDRLGPRALSAHLRTFADYLVFEFSTSGVGHHVTKCVEALNDMIWKHNVITIDRLILCLALRNLEGSEAQVCFFIIQLLLLKPSDFRNRVNEFIKENSPEHWMMNNWHDKHMAFHRKFPERFYHESMSDISTQANQMLPVYFGNVCLRFLPVFDIVIHRFLELPPVAKSLEILLDHLGDLYKFHDRPVTYLCNTLHYYEKKLRDRPALKRKLVKAIIGSLKEIRPNNWCLTEQYQLYMQQADDDINWIPDHDYYVHIIGRLVDTICGKNPPTFPNFDWRFNEFPNPAAHALHSTCVELMALPVASETVGNALLDIVLKGSTQIPRDQIMAWMNAIGLVLTALPESYWSVINEKILEVMQNLQQTNLPPNVDLFQIFNFTLSYNLYCEMECAYLLCLCHAVWQHASIGQLSVLPMFMKEKLRGVIKTESQYLLLCHIIGPFLPRFHAERTRCLLELTVELYEILANVDKASDHLSYMDPISDFLYHIKYMFVGDGVKTDVEKIIRNYRPALQLRLRFIAHHGKEDPGHAASIPAPSSVSSVSSNN